MHIEREKHTDADFLPLKPPHCNPIKLLQIATFINNLCPFISGMIHSVCVVVFCVCMWEGLSGMETGGWLNNEKCLRGNEELCHSISWV